MSRHRDHQTGRVLASTSTLELSCWCLRSWRVQTDEYEPLRLYPSGTSDAVHKERATLRAAGNAELAFICTPGRGNVAVAGVPARMRLARAIGTKIQWATNQRMRLAGYGRKSLGSVQRTPVFGLERGTRRRATRHPHAPIPSAAAPARQAFIERIR